MSSDPPPADPEILAYEIHHIKKDVAEIKADIKLVIRAIFGFGLSVALLVIGAAVSKAWDPPSPRTRLVEQP